MLNHIVLMGRLTRDPELRYTQSQIPVASFTLAVDRDRTLQDGSRETDFIDCVAWRSTAEFVSKYFSKGSMAVASGRLQLRDWTDRDGNKRRSAEVVADSVYFGEPKRKDGGERSESGYAPQSSYGSQSGYSQQGSYSQAPPRQGGANGSYGGYSTAHGAPPAQNPAPEQDYRQGKFAELDDDGELPF